MTLHLDDDQLLPHDTVALTRAALAERTGQAAASAPVRIVHLGLGAFCRAHLAAYTAEVDEENRWGIAAFTGRSAAAAAELAPQDGLFTLLERSGDADRAQMIPSIVEARDGADLLRLRELIVSAGTVIVTLTITEAGYRLLPDGRPDETDPIVIADIALLSTAFAAGRQEHDAPPLRSTLARLVWALAARRRAGGAGLAIVPCDNMPANGALVRRGVLALAARVDAALARWIADEVSFVSTSVDRITPRTTAADVAEVAALTGWADAAPVVTEPFRDWVLSGEFPGGRPRWERAGATFVDDIEPFERRKLWLLNGAHSLLAYAGILRGHATVADAVADPLCREAVDAFWDEAVRHLPRGLQVAEYRAALIERFENARIAHHLAQISVDGVAKLRVRAVPVALSERGAGRDAAAAARLIGAWVALVLRGDDLVDARGDEVRRACGEPDAVRALLALLDERLAADHDFLDRVRTAGWQTVATSREN